MVDILVVAGEERRLGVPVDRKDAGLEAGAVIFCRGGVG